MRLNLLKIRNFAIIENLEVSFDPGFTVITGETGAGKSIIIDALSIALGEKTNPAHIRNGNNSMVIECTFEIDPGSKIAKYIQNNLNHDLVKNTLSLKREVNSNSRSKGWIDSTVCSISTLKQIGDLVVDLHGQHDHQSLLNESTHLSFLDTYGNYPELNLTVANHWKKIQQIQERLHLLQERQQLFNEKKELWQYHLQEINKVNPDEAEYSQLLIDQKIAVNAEKISLLCQDINNTLYEGEDNLYFTLSEVFKKLNALNRLSDTFTEYLRKMQDSKYLFQELAQYLADFQNTIEFDEKKLETMNQRIFSVQQLMKKYNRNISEINEYRKELTDDLNQDLNLNDEIKNTQDLFEVAVKHYSQAALQLSKQRKATAHHFEMKLIKLLEQLGISKSIFKVEFERVPHEQGLFRYEGKCYKADQSGADQIRFLISTNPGEGLKPLTSIVSGGEVSRIMLAIKSLFAGKDNIPILIFDEIDTGISGPTAKLVGEKLRELAHNHQVICITHLPQIAGCGTQHLKVEKILKNNRNYTVISHLDKEQRISEIAKLIGGRTISRSGIEQAKELLE
jgi:DNA repair protein RecN (Recombination protein N)